MPKPRLDLAAQFLFENSLFLIGGAIAALVWANVDLESYHQFLHTSLIPGSHEVGYSLLHVVNDGLMAVFFAMAAKEVWESLLPGGPLSKWKTAATPLMATLGGVVMPTFVYITGCLIVGQWDTLGRGWAVPCATDIAFSYLIARIVFGAGHPAIAFLLLLAIADDAAGLLILAVAYPQEALQPQYLLGAVGAVAWGLLLRRLGVRSFWVYLLGPGVLSWLSFHYAGIHAALGLVPIIPTLPHAAHDPGLFAEDEQDHDTLSEFARWWKNPVELILGLFGLVNAGVVFSNTGPATWLVLSGLLIGKPLGITLFTFLGEKLFHLERPDGMTYGHIVTLGMVAAIGFTVALFVSTAAFNEPGAIQDSAKMGALASFAAAIIAIPLGRALKVKSAAAPLETSE
ncbi:Na+/H+ antiporter NhaA [Fuerstiella marisgermanici]|uniref:Na(+)/H(+) antiporter NhaA n=1 Tax=Fuerstiella marisgermanici TaxID=1891926 RepID=A0A1P8WEW5_9PLAN|nr:Na+/H+ antiporter NhaA [Fuerstiella marisgermanici]APZ92598.1 Sodium/proton antiporter NhaA [Fuerstiella marisgermanici]